MDERIRKEGRDVEKYLSKDSGRNISWKMRKNNVERKSEDGDNKKIQKE